MIDLSFTGAHMNNNMRRFREHIKTEHGAAYPREDEISDRRAFIAALGGVIVGGVFVGCGDWRKNKVAGGMEWPQSKLDKGPPDAGPPDIHVTSGVPDMAQAPLDQHMPPYDAAGGMPDMPAPMDLVTPPTPDLKVGPPEFALAGIAPPPDAAADATKPKKP